MAEKTDEEITKLHNESVKKYNNAKYSGLNLHEKEFVIIDIKRHWIGKFSIYLATVAMLVVSVFAGIFFQINTPLNNEQIRIVALGLTLAVAIVSLLVGFVSVYNYNEDWFIVTNLRILVNNRRTLLAVDNQEIDLIRVEDIEYHKHGFFQTIFNYGIIHCSTVGNENTYNFSFVSNPAKIAAELRDILTDYNEKHAGIIANLQKRGSR